MSDPQAPPEPSAVPESSEGTGNLHGNHESKFHDRHRTGVTPRNQQWLEQEDLSANSIVETERLRHERAAEFGTLMEAVGDNTRKKVLAALVQERRAMTYDEILEYAPVNSKRQVKNHVHDLRDRDVLTVEDGRPALIYFSDDEVETLAVDALCFAYSA